MAFIKFEKGSRGYAGAFVTAFSGGGTAPPGALLGFNVTATQVYNLEDYRSCDVFYDPDDRLIGFKFFADEVGEQKLRHANGGTQVYAPGFLSYFQINVESVKRLLIISKEGVEDFLMIKVPK